MTYTIPMLNLSNGGLSFASSLSTQIPVLIPGMMAVIYLLLAGSTYFLQERRQGRGDLPYCMVASTIVVVILETILSISPWPIINNYTIVMTIAIGIVSFVAFFTTERT